MLTISNAISKLLLTNSCHPQHFLSTAIDVDEGREETLKIWKTKKDERRRIADRCKCIMIWVERTMMMRILMRGVELMQKGGECAELIIHAVIIAFIWVDAPRHKLTFCIVLLVACLDRKLLVGPGYYPNQRVSDLLLRMCTRALCKSRTHFFHLLFPSAMFRTCNYGKLNYHLGKRAADEGRSALDPDIDFCDFPQGVCSSDENMVANCSGWQDSSNGQIGFKPTMLTDGTTMKSSRSSPTEGTRTFHSLMP